MNTSRPTPMNGVAVTASEWSAVGRRIVDVRPIEFADLGHAIALVLDDGSKVYASQDIEGNGPGELFVDLPDGNEIVIYVGHAVKEIK